MLFKNLSRSVVACSLLSLAVACGAQQQESARPEAKKIDASAFSKKIFNDEVSRANRGNVAIAAVDCEAVWTGVVAANPTGLLKAYEENTVTAYSGLNTLPPPAESLVSFEQVILESSADIIRIQTTVSAASLPAPQVQVDEYKKADFIAACNTPAAEEPEASLPEGTTIEILEEGKATLTVRGGTFETDYTKAKIVVTGEGAYEAIATTWVTADENQDLVKDVTESVSVFGVITVTTTVTTELVRFEKPVS